MKKKLKRIGIWLLVLFVLVPFVLLATVISLVGTGLHRLGECMKELYYRWVGDLL